MKLHGRNFLICLLSGLVLLAAGLLVPAHLRALDEVVLQAAGRNQTGLADAAQKLAGEKKLGQAQLLAAAAQAGKLPGWDTFGAGLGRLERQFPDAQFWGGDVAAESRFAGSFKPPDQTGTFASFIIRPENRETALGILANSPNPTVEELLNSRRLTATALFAPSSSAAGQAFDAAVAIAGLLVEGGHLTGGMNGDLQDLASEANHGGGSLPLEEVLMDFTSLAERFNWDQLTAFAEQIPTASVLHQLAASLRAASEQTPVLFAVVQLSGRPAEVADYLAKFPETGMPDLGRSLRYGPNGVRELTASRKQLESSSMEERAAVFFPANTLVLLLADMTAQNPSLALAVKWILIVLAGFFLALALRFLASPPADRLLAGGFHLYRECLFSLGFLLVVLLVTEPFLAADTQPGTFSLRLLPSVVGGAVLAETVSLQKNIMNPTILLTLLIFLILQALVYVSCLVKLAEILRQRVRARFKLKLLENEDHLFDAGLYLGFVGTIASLIIASLGLVKFSLMAAYSSTSFGIIFVVIFKIFHLRPARRQLLLEAEAESATEKPVPAVAPTSTATP